MFTNHVVDHHFIKSGRDAFPHTLKGVFGSGSSEEDGKISKIHKDRMFRQLSAELNLGSHTVYHLDGVYLLLRVVLPQYGFSGRVMQIYPCLAAGYFILFILYAEIIFCTTLTI